MQLPVPELKPADSGSFPQEPDAVARWLADLAPAANDDDARELLRGLTHSNRLHNDPVQRRACLQQFLGPLQAVYDRLSASTRAQPLPLVRDFKRDATLADALLREESTAYRLLLAADETPQPEDACRAMRALLRRAELAVQGYRSIANEVWRDAHTLYQFVRAVGLDKSSEPASDATASQHYRLLLVLGIIDGHRYRARQLPLLIDWLRDRAHMVAVSASGLAREDYQRDSGRWVVDLARGTAPAPAGSVLITDTTQAHIVDVTPLRRETLRRIRAMRMTQASLLGEDTLEQHTLAQLAQRLETQASKRPMRQQARRRDAQAVDCVFSHKPIASRLLHESALHGDAAGTEPVLTAKSKAVAAWHIIDRSVAGCQIWHPAAAAGSVQVGELVCLRALRVRQPDSTSDATRRDVQLGMVRYLRVQADGSLCAGISILAHAVMPVVITRSSEREAAPENGLIIAGRSEHQRIQTILVPPFLFHAGEELLLAHGERAMQVELGKCLHLNGLFSQYQIKPVPRD